MRRRIFIQGMAALGLTAGLAARADPAPKGAGAVSVEELPELRGDLTVYLGRGEGGLYEDVMTAIRNRNPALNLRIRRGPTVALANTIVAEARAGMRRADLFWAVDSGSLGLVASAGLARELPADLRDRLAPPFRYSHWVPVSGRIRTLPYNPQRLSADRIPRSIMALAESDLNFGWAPAYGAFQSFVTALRLLEGEERARTWLRAVKHRAKSFAGEFGVVMATARGEVDLGFANHYYTLRLKAGKPHAAVDLAFTHNDAGCLLNASGAMALGPGETPINFIRYLLTSEVQSYLATEAYEIPMVNGIGTPPGLPPLARIGPPELDLTRLAELRPTLDLLRDTGVL